MKKYEYKREICDFSPDKLLEICNQFGNDGWALIYVINRDELSPIYMFIREKILNDSQWTDNDDS